MALLTITVEDGCCCGDCNQVIIRATEDVTSYVLEGLVETAECAGTACNYVIFYDDTGVTIPIDEDTVTDVICVCKCQNFLREIVKNGPGIADGSYVISVTNGEGELTNAGGIALALESGTDTHDAAEKAVVYAAPFVGTPTLSVHPDYTSTNITELITIAVKDETNLGFTYKIITGGPLAATNYDIRYDAFEPI